MSKNFKLVQDGDEGGCVLLNGGWVLLSHIFDGRGGAKEGTHPGCGTS